MKNSFMGFLAIIISVAALATSIYTVTVVNDLQSQLLNNTDDLITASDTRLEDQQSEEPNTTPSVSTHTFDESLVGDWSNGYWEMKILEDSTFYLDGADYYGQGENKFIYIGYIENNKLLAEYRVDCSLDEYLSNQEGYIKSEVFETADIVREATNSFQIQSLSNVQPSLSFRRK